MEKDKYSQDREGNLLKCTLKRTRGQILNEDRRSTPAEYAGTIRVPVRRPDHNYPNIRTGSVCGVRSPRPISVPIGFIPPQACNHIFFDNSG